MLLGLKKCEVQDALMSGGRGCGVHIAVYSCILELKMSQEHGGVTAVCCGEVFFRSPRCYMECLCREIKTQLHELHFHFWRQDLT